MNLVNQAGSASEISPRPSFVCKNVDVFILEVGLAQLSRSQFLRPGRNVLDKIASLSKHFRIEEYVN